VARRVRLIDKNHSPHLISNSGPFGLYRFALTTALLSAPSHNLRRSEYYRIVHARIALHIVIFESTQAISLGCREETHK
jgi:succinate-acetate transporter protein